jgi:hypothetical protein
MTNIDIQSATETDNGWSFDTPTAKARGILGSPSRLALTERILPA